MYTYIYLRRMQHVCVHASQQCVGYIQYAYMHTCTLWRDKYVCTSQSGFLHVGQFVSVSYSSRITRDMMHSNMQHLIHMCHTPIHMCHAHSFICATHPFICATHTHSYVPHTLTVVSSIRNNESLATTHSYVPHTLIHMCHTHSLICAAHTHTHTKQTNTNNTNKKNHKNTYSGFQHQWQSESYCRRESCREETGNAQPEKTGIGWLRLVASLKL